MKLLAIAKDVVQQALRSAERSAVLIDTHCHLDEEYFPEGPHAVLQRGRDASVAHFVVIGVGSDAKAARRAIALSTELADVTATVGMHPHDARHLDDRLFEELGELSAHPSVAAVGEVGLDFHYNFSPPEVQQRVFRKMIQLARMRQKPLVIHTREAPDLTLAILREEDAREVGGVIHCFSEDRGFARHALDLGFDISLSGIVTFKNATGVHDVARWAPTDRLMVETDSPYLAPVPHRGKRCEPAFVAHTARRVAELRGVSLESFLETSGQVARDRFNIGQR